MTLEQEQGILYDPEMKELLDYFRKENDKQRVLSQYEV